MTDRVAEAFPPGEFVREEMEAREWSQLDLAQILDLQPAVINQILAGKRKVTLETAKRLGEAFGTSTQLWLHLQTQFDIWESREHQNDAVARRATIYSKAPVREMMKRGWIEQSSNLDVLEERVCRFLNIKGLSDNPKFPAAARTSLPEQTIAQRAWLFRAKQLAESLPAPSYSGNQLSQCVGELHRHMEEPEETRHVAKVLAGSGIRFVVVEPLPKTRIDGACFWLDRSSPVVALSLRYDRIDSFWHTLFHELGHVKNRDASLDIDLGQGPPSRQSEVEADKYAARNTVPQEELENFVARTKPLYSHAKIVGFARKLGIHPGLVVGQLQFRREIGFSHSRKFLARVRKFVISSSLTDGWGSMLPTSP